MSNPDPQVKNSDHLSYRELYPMEGTSSGLAVHLDNILPKEVQFVLDWNPPQLRTERDSEADVGLPTRAPLGTALSALQTSILGCSLQAAFYDRHIAPHLILGRVIYLDTLVSTMAKTVDQAIQEAIGKRPLSKDTSMLVSEMGVTEAYSRHAAEYCCPIASTLALHPSSEHWDSILYWTSDGKMGRWAIADGVPFIPQGGFADDQWKQRLLENEVDGKKGIIEQLASRTTALAVWEMKNLTVGTAEVMKEIVEMGSTNAKFPWKKCTLPIRNHRLWDSMEESKGCYDPGFDPRSPPWTLPILPSTSAANSRPASKRKGLGGASAQGETTAFLLYSKTPMSPVEDGEEGRGKRCRNGLDVSDYEGPHPKKSKADSMDKSYEPPTNAEINAQSFLQQTWAVAVRNKCTIMVLHSGNHEIIGIRHRETQTLYISDVIEPHSCSNPAYGKIQVGIYIAAIQETMDRARQDIEASEKRARDLPTDVFLERELASPDAYLDDYSMTRPTGFNKWSRGSCSEGIDDQALLANAARKNHLCLHFFYDIYDSPHPATFRRILDEPNEAPGTAGPPTPSVSPGRETTPPSAPSIHITVHSELQPGSTGIVHVGTMAMDSSGPTAKVAVKIAFSSDEKSRLLEEHRIYSHLHSRSVQGIPRDIGLFVDEEPLLGTEGPHALVMTYTGVSLFRCYKQASDSRRVRDSLLATLESIHRANILQGDIRLPNLCVTPSGEAFVIDFGHATKSCSRKEKAQEMRELSRILEMKSPHKGCCERRREAGP